MNPQLEALTAALAETETRIAESEIAEVRRKHWQAARDLCDLLGLENEERDGLERMVLEEVQVELTRRRDAIAKAGQP